MVARTSAIIAWMFVAVCAVAAAVAAILFGNTNPSGAAEFNCALGAAEYCQEIEQTALLHQMALYILVGVGMVGVGCLIWAVVSTLVALDERNVRLQPFAIPLPLHPGYYSPPSPPYAPPYLAPPYAAPSAPLPQATPPTSHQAPPSGPA